MEISTDRRTKFRRIASHIAGEDFLVPDELADWVDRGVGEPIVTELTPLFVAIAALALAMSADGPTTQTFVGDWALIPTMIRVMCSPESFAESREPSDDIVCRIRLESGVTHEFWFVRDMAELPGPVWQLV